MTAITASSAADVGYAKTQNFNAHNLQKDFSTHVKYVKIFNDTNKTQIKHDNSIRLLKIENTTKKGITHSKNTVNEIHKTHATDSKKVISYPKAQKHLTAKKVVKHSMKNSVNIQVNTNAKTSLKSDSIKNSANTQVKNPTTSVTKQKKSKVKYAAAGSKKKIKKSKKVNTKSVKKLAASLTKGTKSKYKKAQKIFNWVRDHIRYKFYYNTKYGAKGTLKKRAGNCVDHSHLIVALARSAGLQAKYAHGKVRFPSGHVYGHVWALIKVNGKWYKADATSSKNSFGVMKGKIIKLKGIYKKLPF